MLRKPVAGTAIAAIVLTVVQFFGAVNAAAASQTINLGFSGSAPARSMLNIGGGHGGLFSAGASLNAGLDWQTADQVGVSYTDGNLRQGSQLDLTDSTTPGAGTVSVHYEATGNLSADSFDQSVTDSIPCAMPLAGDPANTCTDNTSIALDSVTVASSGFASLQVALSLNVATTITATGSPRETTRIASVAGGLAIPDAPLSLIGPTPGHLTDPMSLTSIACTQPAGSHLVYSLTSNHTTGTLDMVTTVDLVAAIVASPLIGPNFTLFSGTISPSSVSSPSVLFSLAMNAADAGVDLGAILPDVTPPTVNAGGPYSGVEGASVLFDGSASSDKCGPPTLAWTFGDGSSAAGSRPNHTYAEEGVYGATLTATNVTGLSSSSSFNIPVSDAMLSALGRTIITAEAFSGTVASFTDADPAGAVADYTASISWGDGTTTAGAVSAVAGGFSVTRAYLRGRRPGATDSLDNDLRCGGQLRGDHQPGTRLQVHGGWLLRGR